MFTVYAVMLSLPLLLLLVVADSGDGGGDDVVVIFICWLLLLTGCMWCGVVFGVLRGSAGRWVMPPQSECVLFLC